MKSFQVYRTGDPDPLPPEHPLVQLHHLAQSSESDAARSRLRRKLGSAGSNEDLVDEFYQEGLTLGLVHFSDAPRDAEALRSPVRYVAACGYFSYLKAVRRRAVESAHKNAVGHSRPSGHSPADSQQDAIDGAELRARVSRALAERPAIVAKIFLMHAGGEKCTEIAQQLELNYWTCNRTLKLVLTHLRIELADLDPER